MLKTENLKQTIFTLKSLLEHRNFMLSFSYLGCTSYQTVVKQQPSSCLDGKHSPIEIVQLIFPLLNNL
jgi:hypothetical protein